MTPEERAAQQLSQMRAGGSSAWADPTDPPVWLGQSAATGGQASPFYKGGFKPNAVSAAPVMVPSSEGVLEFNRWTPAQRNEWGDHLAAIGFIDPKDSRDYGVLSKSWSAVMNESAKFVAIRNPLAPKKIAEIMAGFNNGGTAAGSGSGSGSKSAKEPGFTGAKTTSQNQVDLTDPQTARALVNSVLAKTLGRNATSEEITSFTAVLNQAERANPSKSTTTTQYADGAATSSSTQTTGGVSSQGAQQLMTDQAMKKPDYGAFQAATTYMGALASAIQSPV